MLIGFIVLLPGVAQHMTQQACLADMVGEAIAPLTSSDFDGVQGSKMRIGEDAGALVHWYTHWYTHECFV